MDLVKGKKIGRAKTILDFTNKRASKAVKKLLNSAEANALDKGEKSEELYIKNIAVDEGVTLKRMRPRAMGRGVIIRKRTSNLKVTLGKDDSQKKESRPKNKKEEKSKSSPRPKNVENKTSTKKKTEKKKETLKK